MNWFENDEEKKEKEKKKHNTRVFIEKLNSLSNNNILYT